MQKYSDADLILNRDGSIYHLHLMPDEISDLIITVGDPDRVEWVSKYFDRIEVEKQHREYKTNTGYIGKRRITVISTGIGYGNIDIVINELDALVNVDFDLRQNKEEFKQLQFVRIGTSGTLLPEIALGQNLVSAYAIGLDNWPQFYEFDSILDEFAESLAAFHEQMPELKGHSYMVAADPKLMKSLGSTFYQGTTITCPGFYAPQGRNLRLNPKIDQLLNRYRGVKLENRTISNFEMETAAIYSLAKIAGHAALSFNAILANRALGAFHPNPGQAIQVLIESVLEKVESMP
ncbi:MAG: nucleoside phosphorylase [Saprospiraceae bacterium]